MSHPKGADEGTGVMAIFIKTDEGTGVNAILIGTDTVEGVAGIGIGIAFGAIFSKSAAVIALQELVKDSVFCVLSSFAAFATFAFDDTLDEMEAKGCLVRGDSMP
ncbi:hypothetical protein A2U01_0032076 [Trifolium medium]|uniref:Uncharacterized protein n=1 Tax=Trifolium medium TaxID=97028 RepID=A0A392PFV4_9FABA|nr:hypothetical protein [Trifolium medium]